MLAKLAANPWPGYTSARHDGGHAGGVQPAIGTLMECHGRVMSAAHRGAPQPPRAMRDGGRSEKMTAKNGPARRCPHGQHCWLGEYDAAMMKRYDLTLQDVQFLSWFGRFLQSGKMEESAERPGYYWICYRQVLKDLPSIGLSQSRYLGEMCKRLRAKGVFRGNHVEHHRRGQGSTSTFLEA